VLGEQLLVGGDDVAPGAHRAQQVFPRRIDPADQLDDQVRGLEDLLERARGRGQHTAQLRSQAGDALDPVGVAREQLLERRADGAAAEQPDPEQPIPGAHRTSRLIRSAYVSRRTTIRADPPRQKTTGGRGTPL